MVKDHRGLRPMDAYAEQQVDELPAGNYNMRAARMTGKYKEEREGLRGLWWAGCDLLSQNVEHKLWDTKRKVSDEILKGLGFVRPRFRIDKTVDMIPVSTSEENMDDEEFIVLLERARALCLDRWGMDPFQAWVDEQDELTGGRR